MVLRKDESRLVAELAAQMVKEILDNVHMRIFAGPAVGVLSPRAALARLNKAGPSPDQLADPDKLIHDALAIGGG